jgi:site-specific recombinase XerD
MKSEVFYLSFTTSHFKRVINGSLAYPLTPRPRNLDLKGEADIDLERNLIYFGRTKNRKVKVVPMNSAARHAVEWFLNNGKGQFFNSSPCRALVFRAKITNGWSHGDVTRFLHASINLGNSSSLANLIRAS